jgi:ABC-type phosphate transport system auxiliary subunit
VYTRYLLINREDHKLIIIFLVFRWLFMGRKEGKRIITKINDVKIWDSFLKHIKGVHGKTYGYVGMEVQNALKQYVESYDQLSIREYEIEIESLKMEIENLKGLEEKYKQLQNSHDKLRNRYDHLQERFIKGQKELNMLERDTRKLHVVLAKIEKLSFLERVLNRLPEEVKQLTSGTEDEI